MYKYSHKVPVSFVQLQAKPNVRTEF